MRFSTPTLAIVSLFLSFLAMPTYGRGQQCSDSNALHMAKPQPASSDTAQHDMGQHFIQMSQAQTQCTYTSSGSTQANCNTQCGVVNAAATTNQPLAGTTSGESLGSRLNVSGSHSVAIGWNTGQATSANGGASCTGTLGGGAVHCGLLTLGCNIGVTFNGSSFSITSTNGTPIWTANNPLANNCGTIPDPINSTSGGGVTDPCYIDPNSPDCCAEAFSPVAKGSGCPPLISSESPIIIDTLGEGFHLTSAAGGVMFDMSGSGHPLQIAWTAAGSQNAFLALPGGDGLIHNGTQLFGNFTNQPASNHPNGFLALAEFDKPENGGNGDGVIDERDGVFSRLRLWIDENHDGVSQPDELRALLELGVYSLSLNYFESRREDQFGNQFRYKARVNPDQGRRDPRDATPSGDPGRWTYDVFLIVR